MTLRALNYGNYGIFLIMGNAGFCPSTVGLHPLDSSTPRPLNSKPIRTVTMTILEGASKEALSSPKGILKTEPTLNPKLLNPNP